MAAGRGGSDARSAVPRQAAVRGHVSGFQSALSPPRGHTCSTRKPLAATGTPVMRMHHQWQLPSELLCQPKQAAAGDWQQA